MHNEENRHMETFYYILQKHMNVKRYVSPRHGLYDYWTHIFTEERGVLNTQNRFVYMHYYSFIDFCYKDLCLHNDEPIDHLIRANVKFYNLDKILNNEFVLNKDENLLFFCKAQRTYWALNRLVRNYRLRKSPVRNAMDLYMNHIDITNSSSLMVYQDGAKYYFRIPDLINIIDQALLNNSHHFPEPLYPKNPYTNLEFSEAVLLNIYQKIKNSNFKFPVLFHYFYLSKFEVDTFLHEYETVINDLHIKDYTFNSSSDVLYEDVRLLIKLYNRPKKLHIDREFPKKRLVDILRPYLYLHYVYEFSISETEKRESALSTLKRKFDSFIHFNPQFGRKVLSKPPGSKWFSITGFNEKHINFNDA
jgi:hypothetical protein